MSSYFTHTGKYQDKLDLLKSQIPLSPLSHENVVLCGMEKLYLDKWENGCKNFPELRAEYASLTTVWEELREMVTDEKLKWLKTNWAELMWEMYNDKCVYTGEEELEEIFNCVILWVESKKEKLVLDKTEEKSIIKGNKNDP